MRRVTIAIVTMIVLGAAACQRWGGSSPFLETGSAQWDRWLDGETEHGSFTRFSVGAILGALSGPADITVLASRDELARKIELFDVKGLTRRQALRKLSEKHGLSLQWATTHEPRTFLDVLETEERAGGPVGCRTMTLVYVETYAEYVARKKEGRVSKEMDAGDFVYYAVDAERDIRPPNGPSCWFTEVERFKARKPAQVSAAKFTKAEALRLIEEDAKMRGDTPPGAWLQANAVPAGTEAVPVLIELLKEGTNVNQMIFESVLIIDQEHGTNEYVGLLLADGLGMGVREAAAADCVRHRGRRVAEGLDAVAADGSRTAETRHLARALSAKIVKWMSEDKDLREDCRWARDRMRREEPSK